LCELKAVHYSGYVDLAYYGINGNGCALQGHNGLIGTGHFEGAIATVAQQLHDGRAYRNIGMEDQDRLNCAGTFTI
jgi:hypothetical protein